jgi:predicted glycogen debranching enzyme
MNEPIIRRVAWRDDAGLPLDTLLAREWLVTNGLGGYASGTVCGVPTRRFHGLLIAALAAPLGRTMTLHHLCEEVVLADGVPRALGAEARGNDVPAGLGAELLREFRLEDGLPVWTYEVEDAVIEKRVFLPHRQNTVLVSYRLLAGPPRARLRLRPGIHFRGHEAPLNTARAQPYVLSAVEGGYEVAGGPGLPTLRLRISGGVAAFAPGDLSIPEVAYRVEEDRGYDARGELWSPGYLEAELAPAMPVTLAASTEPWATVTAVDPAAALAAEVERRRHLLERAGPAVSDPVAAELVIAADQFIITPVGRAEDTARARAAGEEPRTVIAGYHWFTDWGRDTMISLEGLTLVTGRHAEARWILRTFAQYVRDGLIPNMFPEGENTGLYHTADATLWFFHAVDRYAATTGDRETLRVLLPILLDIVDHHLRGTRFGIGVDPADGLLREGAEGYQLTWMDAKCDGWVVTPRRGKPVEINALWHNALRLMSGWLQEEGLPRAPELAGHADRAQASFNRRFWYAEGGHLYDVVDGPDGDDAACRPNQVFAISLRHAALDPARWPPVMENVRARLLTPVGLRSLAPGHPDYKEKYWGDLRARDAAYHQGTVWGWLIGPFVDAWLKVHPGDLTGARRLLDGFAAHLGEACIGSISEVFDAEAPFTPRGCVAQAWSVAEVLRCWTKTGPSPAAGPGTSRR